MNGAPKLKFSNEGFQEHDKKPETRLEEDSAMVLEGLKEETRRRNLPHPANENDSISHNEKVITKYEEVLVEDEDPFGPFTPMQYSPDEVRKAVERAKKNDANHNLR